MKMQLLKNRESGQALITVLVLLALGGLLVVPTLNLASTNLNYHQVVEKNTLETYAADSGVRYALCKLGNNPGEFGPEPLPSAVNDKTVNVTVEYIGGNIYKITSTATTDSGSSTSIESYVKVKISLFSNAITVTDGDLLLQGTTIDGDVYAGGEVTIQDSVVTGTITENGTEEFDLLDTEPYKTEAQNGGIIEGNLILGAGTHTLGPVYITGYLKIQEGAEVTLGGTVYVEGSEKMDGNLAIHIQAGSSLTGTGNLIAEEGDIKIETARFELDNIPLVAALTGSIKIENCEYIKALLYAPEVSIRAEENIEICGALFTANTCTIENCTIIYPEDTEGSELLSNKLEMLSYTIKK